MRAALALGAVVVAASFAVSFYEDGFLVLFGALDQLRGVGDRGLVVAGPLAVAALTALVASLRPRAARVAAMAAAVAFGITLLRVLAPPGGASGALADGLRPGPGAWLALAGTALVAASAAALARLSSRRR